MNNAIIGGILAKTLNIAPPARDDRALEWSISRRGAAHNRLAWPALSMLRLAILSSFHTTEKLAQ